MKKFTSYLSIALCAILSFSSCDKEDITANKLLGTWEWVSSTTYYSDGTSETENTSNADSPSITFTESVIKGGDDELPYTLDDKTIYILGGLLTWEIEELTNKKLKFKQSSVSCPRKS